MKSTLTSYFVFLLVVVASCKKDDDSGQLAISGNYTVYRIIVEDPDDGPQESQVPLPNGDYIKAEIKANKDSSMSVKVIYLNQQNVKTDEVTLTGRAKKIGNSLRFMDGNNWLGTFLDNAEVELYPDGTTALYARK
jgi:hypothetical protein